LSYISVQFAMYTSSKSALNYAPDHSNCREQALALIDGVVSVMGIYNNNLLGSRRLHGFH